MKKFEVFAVPFDDFETISLGWVYAKSVDDEFVIRSCNDFLKRWITKLGYNPSKFKLVSDPYRIRLLPIKGKCELERFENRKNRIFFENNFILYMRYKIYNHNGNDAAKAWINCLGVKNEE